MPGVIGAMMQGMKVAAAGVAVAAIVSGCLVSPVIPIGSGRSREDVQHDRLDQLFPAQLTAPERWTGELRVAKLRVWADDDYRAQNVQWQHGFDEQLAYANQVLTPMLGVRLEAEYRSWDRHAPGATLVEHLDALSREDPGADVVWIVGLTSSLSLVASSFEQAGVANLGERHVIVRGLADLEERKAFDGAFPDIDREQREAVLAARRRHKMTTLVIHELAHSLGALHETQPDSVMHGIYSHRAASISPRNRELMLITLEDRLKPAAARDPRATAQKLLAAVEVEWAGWDAEDRAPLIASLREQVGAHAGGITGPLPADAVKQLRGVEKVFLVGDNREAAAALAPLLAAYPAYAELHMLSCRIELAHGGPEDPAATAACDRAAALSPDAGTAIEIAGLLQSRGDAAGARAALVAAEARIAGLPRAQAAVAWLKLAEHYRDKDAVTWAEAAAANANTGAADHGIAAWARTLRVRFGIPRDGARYKLVPEDDAAALGAVRDVIGRANASEFAAATRAADAAEKRWPGLPGLLAARCHLALRRGSLTAARQLCARSLAQGESSWALYASGVIELRGTSKAATAAGIARLRKAIALDPGLVDAWYALARVFDRTHAAADLDQLSLDYQRQFGAPLPR